MTGVSWAPSWGLAGSLHVGGTLGEGPGGMPPQALPGWGERTQHCSSYPQRFGLRFLSFSSGRGFTVKGEVRGGCGWVEKGETAQGEGRLCGPVASGTTCPSEALAAPRVKVVSGPSWAGPAKVSGPAGKPVLSDSTNRTAVVPVVRGGTEL